MCQSNPDAVLALAADGRLIALTPTGSETGARNSLLVMRLLPWADQQGGWKVFDSSTGFRLDDGSVLSPDACPYLVVDPAGPRMMAPEGSSPCARSGALPREWCPARLAAHSQAAGCGDLVCRRPCPAEPRPGPVA